MDRRFNKKNILLTSMFVFSASVVPSSVVLSAIFFSPAKKFFVLAGGDEKGLAGNYPGEPSDWQDRKVAMRPYGETIKSRYRQTTSEGDEFWALTNQDENGNIPANSTDMVMDILGVHNGGTWRYWTPKIYYKNYGEDYVFHGTATGNSGKWNPNMNGYTHRRGYSRPTADGGTTDYSTPWCDGPYYFNQSNDSNSWYWEVISVYTAWRIWWNVVVDGGDKSSSSWWDDNYAFKLIPNQIIYHPLRKIGGTSYSHWVGNNFNSSTNLSWPKGTYVDQSEALAIPKTATALPNNFFSSANTSAPNVKKVFEDNRTETLTRTTDLPVGNNAFSSRTKLESIDLQHATTIGDSAFQNSSNINSISLPKATTVGQSAFAGLIKLESLLLPTVTTLGQNAFNGDANLKYINLAGLETTPNANAFAGCSSLTNLKLGVRPSNSKPLDYTGNFLSNTKIFTGNDTNRSIFIPFRNACKANEFSTPTQPWNDSYYNPSFGWTTTRTTGADKRLLSDLFVTYQ
ncbi:MAG: hypothetical protein Ta2E_03390 [Mycoplasmoidaceae bacterium]|nr:MAG: hypothetical protein Ta2E_03390 [Mycoplasmoidaceae bacterium]